MDELPAETWSIRRAGAMEADAIVEILREAALWSARFGELHLAGGGNSPSAEQRELAVAAEQIAGFEGTQIAACMRLQCRDKIYWPDDVEGDALYLHKLAVRRASAGQGWTGRMIDWAVEEGRRSGARFLLLDTLPGTKLVGLYERQWLCTFGRGAETISAAKCRQDGAVVITKAGSASVFTSRTRTISI